MLRGFRDLLLSPGLADHTRRPRKDRGAQLLGLIDGKVRQPHGRLAGVGHLKLEFSETENPRQKRLHNVDCLNAVQARLPLLLEQETRVHPDKAFGHLVAGEVPAENETADCQEQHHSATGQEPRHPAAQVRIHKIPALQHPLESVPAEEEPDGGQRHPAADERRGRMDPLPVAVDGFVR
ncbi:hypothetical protein PJL18_03506 [Paenarthrobacter nicotinovorans]|nr:hypothetical protein [Paenarthrobacter nicotinovorans]